MHDAIIDFYSNPQNGFGLQYYEGERYNQLGSGFFSNVARFILPILKTIGRHALGIGAETVNDVINNDKSIEDALISNAAKRVSINKKGEKRMRF